MKVAVALLFLAAVATLQTSDAWRVQRIIAGVCAMACNNKCTEAGTTCAPVCYKVCNKGRKRRAVANDDDEKPFSADFSKYDINNDGVVKLPEFAEAISSTDGKCEEIFGMADKNSDGVLERSEFLQGPFQFSYGGDILFQDAPDKPAKDY